MVALSFLFFQQVKVPTVPSAETLEHYAPALKHEGRTCPFLIGCSMMLIHQLAR